MESDAPPTDAQLLALQELLASHYIEQELPDDLLAIVVRLLKDASRWFPDPQHAMDAETGLDEWFV